MKKPTTAKQLGFHAWVNPKRNGSKGRVRNRVRAKIDLLPFLNSRTHSDSHSLMVSPKRNGSQGRVRNRVRAKIDNLPFLNSRTHSDSHSLMVSPKRFESWNNP